MDAGIVQHHLVANAGTNQYHLAVNDEITQQHLAVNAGATQRHLTVNSVTVQHYLAMIHKLTYTEQIGSVGFCGVYAVSNLRIFTLIMITGRVRRDRIIHHGRLLQ